MAAEPTTRVTVTTSTTSLLSQHNSRLGASFFNEGPSTVYLSWDNAASTTNYVVQMASGSLYELPVPVHTGPVSAVTAASTSAVQAAEQIG